MARTYYNKKVYSKKRSKLAKRMNYLKPKMGGRLKQPVHYFTRFVEGGSVFTTPASSLVLFARNFQLLNVPGVEEFVAMYDFYKIIAVKWMYIPEGNVSLAGNSGVIQYNDRIYSVIDYNDNNTPTGVNELRQYQNCRVTPNNQVHKRFFYPKPRSLAVNGAQNIDVETIKSPWVRTSGDNDKLPYYGIKVAIETPNLPDPTEIGRIECKYYMAFKGRN